MKKLLFILSFMVIIILSLFVINNVKDSDNNVEEIQVRELEAEKDETMLIAFDRFSGGGGFVNQNISESVATAGGGIGAFGLIYYLSNQIGKLFKGMFSSSDTVVTYETQVTIDDVLSNSNVRDGMNEYGWTRSDIIKWLEIMLGVSVDKFLNDNNIEVYLESTEYELKYYSYRDTDNHKYAFYTENLWEDLVSFCLGDYDMIWVLNMVFLQMCVMKNVTFVLVTPTDKYYKYASKQLIANDDGYFPFYSKELEFINRNGYCWDEFEKPNVRTRK